MSAILRIIFVAGQIALGTVLERLFGEDESTEIAPGVTIKKIIFGVLAFFLVAFAFRFFTKRKVWTG